MAQPRRPLPMIPSARQHLSSTTSSPLPPLLQPVSSEQRRSTAGDRVKRPTPPLAGIAAHNTSIKDEEPRENPRDLGGVVTQSRPLERPDFTQPPDRGRGFASMVLIHEAFGNFDFSDSVGGRVLRSDGYLEQNFHANLNFGNSYVPASFPDRPADGFHTVHGRPYRGVGRACGNFTFSGGSANTHQNFYPLITHGPHEQHPEASRSYSPYVSHEPHRQEPVRYN